MMEIFINECDWAGRSSRLSEIIDKLSSNGWERFGHNGAVVLFKDVNEEAARNEMEKLEISDVTPEFWEEDDVDIF